MSDHQLSAEVQEALTRLILAAREDDAFRQEVLAILKLPLSERTLVVAQAVQRMKQHDEPEDIRQTFQLLADPSAANGMIAALDAP